MNVRRLVYFYNFSKSKSRVQQAFSTHVLRELQLECTRVSSGTSLVPKSPYKDLWDLVPFNWVDLPALMHDVALTRSRMHGG